MKQRARYFFPFFFFVLTPGCYRRVPFCCHGHTPYDDGKSGHMSSVPFIGVLAVQGPKVIRDSGDVATQEQPLAIFEIHATSVCRVSICSASSTF